MAYAAGAAGALGRAEHGTRRQEQRARGGEDDRQLEQRPDDDNGEEGHFDRQPVCYQGVQQYRERTEQARGAADGAELGCRELEVGHGRLGDEPEDRLVQIRDEKDTEQHHSDAPGARTGRGSAAMIGVVIGSRRGRTRSLIMMVPP
ncbi:hypothetical protein [Nonomuraea dietziae]|uniref:hypothetical protein n=1 Tax=Nonomuraea dietziae TaxID=65515 RepID=UPI0031D38A21